MFQQCEYNNYVLFAFVNYYVNARPQSACRSSVKLLTLQFRQQCQYTSWYRRKSHPSVNRFLPLISDSVPSISAVSMLTTRIWCHPPAMWISDSVTRCQSGIITKQLFHGLKALSVDLEQEKAELERRWWRMWNIGSAQYLGADHDNIILLPRLPFLFLYYDYLYFYNVSFAMKIIVVNCIVLHFYNT